MIRKLCFIVAIVSLSVGCATTSQGGYYWGDYSSAYYEWLKSPSPETLVQRKESLEDIINTSKEKELRVPPGIYAELGKIYMELKNPEMATSMISAEMETYPESRVFLQRLMEQSQGGN